MCVSRRVCQVQQALKPCFTLANTKINNSGEFIHQLRHKLGYCSLCLFTLQYWVPCTAILVLQPRLFFSPGWFEHSGDVFCLMFNRLLTLLTFSAILLQPAHKQAKQCPHRAFGRLLLCLMTAHTEVAGGPKTPNNTTKSRAKEWLQMTSAGSE